MKKIYTIIISVALFGLTACSSYNGNTQTKGTNPSTNPNNTNQNRTSNNVVSKTENAVGNVGNAVGRTANDVVGGAGRIVGDVAGGVERVADGLINGSENLISGSQTTHESTVNSTNRARGMMEDTTLNATSPSNNNQTNSYNNATTNNNTTNENNTTNTTNSNLDISEKASKIAKSVNQIENIQKATVIITGDTALIGLNLANNLSNEKVTQIKNEAEKKALETDKGIKHVAITSSPEIVDRIINIANDVNSGKPVTGLADELTNMVRRITPSF